MRSWIIRIYGVIIFIIFSIVLFFIGRYIYLRLSFQEIEKQLKNYGNIPYLIRKIDFLENEYKRINQFIEESKTSALVLAKIINIFDKYNVKVIYLGRENYEEGEVYKLKIKGEFKNLILSLGEVENSFLPIKFTKVEMYGKNEIYVSINLIITE